MATGDQQFKEWAQKIEARLDLQDAILKDIRTILAASRFTVVAIRWLAGVAAGVAAVWAALHGNTPHS